MPPQHGPSTKGGAACLLLLLCALSQTADADAACGCYACLSGASCGVRTAPDGDAFATVTDGLDDVVPHAEFRVGDRWFTTASDGGSARLRGDPVTLTWGLVDDGTTITGGEGTSPSDLVAMLDASYGSGGRGGVTAAPWFRLFESAFDRWSELSGVTYLYEPNDGGAPINNTTAPAGRVGVYPDVRIGGHSIDGATGANTLAYNYFPDHADMVIDTDNASFYGNRSGDSVRLRNVLMHEAGHGLGFNHLESNDSGQLMEPFISSAFDGPQIDDILAAHRNYGDVHEKGRGNDLPQFADPVDATRAGDLWSIGRHGRAASVSPDMTDFISIDGANDQDFFRLTVDEPVSVDISLTPVGRSYNEGPQDGTQTRLDASTLNSLRLALQTDDGSGVLTVAAGTPTDRTGLRRVIEGFELTPGQDYFLNVFGTRDNVQLYQLDIGLAAVPVPEPTAAMLAVLGAAAWRRRRAA